MRKSIPLDVIKSIADKFPELNRDWLAFGEGAMLKSDDGMTAIGDNANAQHGDGNTYHNGADAATIDRLIGEMAEQRKQYSQQIDRLLTLLERRP